jgi:hypothetical protein
LGGDGWDWGGHRWWEDGMVGMFVEEGIWMASTTHDRNMDEGKRMLEGLCIEAGVRVTSTMYGTAILQDLCTKETMEGETCCQF